MKDTFRYDGLLYLIKKERNIVFAYWICSYNVQNGSRSEQMTLESFKGMSCCVWVLQIASVRTGWQNWMLCNFLQTQKYIFKNMK